MKQRPNISIEKKSNTKLDYLKYLATENIQPNVSVSSFAVPNVKTKSKPNIKIKSRNLDKINQFRTDMLNYANREIGIVPDLLVEYPTYYMLTITNYTLITNNTQPTAKDFDIYCNGLKLDNSTYDVLLNENIIINIQKSEAVDDSFDENNFEIVSKFDWKIVATEDEFYLNTETDEDIIL